MENAKISIIVPAYNVENYIEKTVKSICNQTYRNIEIILVDDGSKDQTLAILNDLAKKEERIKIIHKENGGVTSARLRGVEAATGEWIGFVDGDDSIATEMYEILISNALKYGADISHCGYRLVLPSYYREYYGTGRLVIQPQKDGLKDLLEGVFIEPGLCNKLYPKKMLDELLCEEKMDLSIKNNEDLLMNFYLFQKSQKAVYEDKCLYNYTLRKNSATTTYSENKLKDGLRVLKILEKETRNDLELQKIIKRRIVSQLISSSTILTEKKDKIIYEYRKLSRKELRERFPDILRGEYSFKQKAFAIWVVICPFSYSVVHLVYGKLRNYDRDLKEVNSI